MSALDLAVAFGAAVLQGLGIGSGGIYLLWLTLAAGVGQTAAQGMNLLFSVAALGAGAAVNARGGRIPLRTLLFCLVAGLPGCVLGSLLAGAVGDAWLRRLLGLLLTVGGGTVLWRTLRIFRRNIRKRRQKTG